MIVISEVCHNLYKPGVGEKVPSLTRFKAPWSAGMLLNVGKALSKQYNGLVGPSSPLRGEGNPLLGFDKVRQ